MLIFASRVDGKQGSVPGNPLELWVALIGTCIEGT
jgi:hypothetical protein